jgi:hypothetical protein
LTGFIIALAIHSAMSVDAVLAGLLALSTVILIARSGAALRRLKRVLFTMSWGDDKANGPLEGAALKLAFGQRDELALIRA